MDNVGFPRILGGGPGGDDAWWVTVRLSLYRPPHSQSGGVWSRAAAVPFRRKVLVVLNCKLTMPPQFLSSSR